MNRKILHISRSGLPINASGVRIDMVLRLFENEGYTVHCICDRHIDGNEQKNGYHPMPQEERSAYLLRDEVHFAVGDRIYSYLPIYAGRLSEKISDAVNVRLSNRILRRIRYYCKKEHPSCIVLYGMSCRMEKLLLRYCRKNGIKLIVDVVEWYEQNKALNRTERFIADTTDRRIRNVDHRLDGVIAISPYLYDYYSEKGAHTLLIPPLMDMIDLQNIHIKQPNTPVRFVYAGSPGSKDIILPFVNALVNVNRNGIRCCIDLIGIDERYLTNRGCVEACASTGVVAHGRLPRAQTVALVKQADFGVLLRHDRRYAKAGFSTKFAECMSMGVGMVCNRIGGTDLFVEDGIDGFLLDDVREDTILRFLQQVIELDAQAVNAIKFAAKRKSEQLFAADAYVDGFHSFIETITGGCHSCED